MNIHVTVLTLDIQEQTVLVCDEYGIYTLYLSDIIFSIQQSVISLVNLVMSQIPAVQYVFSLTYVKLRHLVIIMESVY